MTTGFQSSPPPTPARTGAPAADLADLLESYVFCARAEGKSPRTIDIRITSVLALLDFLRAAGLPTSVHDIGPHELRRFIVHLQGVRAYQSHPFNPPRPRGLSGHTVNGYLRSLRAFWSWLVREEILDSSPFARVLIPKPPKKIIPAFTEGQLRELLAAIPRTTPAGARDWAMLVTLLDTGMRASELTGLTLDDVHLKDGTLKVRGKGDRERTVPVGATAQRALWRYIDLHRPQPRRPRCTALFLTPQGEEVTVNYLEKRVKRYGASAGLEGVRCSPHTFRHTFAVTYLRNGGDVFSLQRILGHSSLEVVRIYVNLSQVDVKECHRRCSPADNLDLSRRGLRRRPASGGSRGLSEAGPGSAHFADPACEALAARVRRARTAGSSPGGRWRS